MPKRRNFDEVHWNKGIFLWDSFTTAVAEMQDKVGQSAQWIPQLLPSSHRVLMGGIAKA